MFKVRKIIPYVLTAAIGVGVGIQIEKHNTDTLAVERLIAPTAASTVEVQASVSATAAVDTAEEVTTAAPGINAEGKININTATSEELQELNGIGPKTAEKIIDDRMVNGAYKNTREITRISGIGDKTYEQIAPYITVQ